MGAGNSTPPKTEAEIKEEKERRIEEIHRTADAFIANIGLGRPQIVIKQTTQGLFLDGCSGVSHSITHTYTLKLIPSGASDTVVSTTPEPNTMEIDITKNDLMKEIYLRAIKLNWYFNWEKRPETGAIVEQFKYTPEGTVPSD